MVHQCGACVNEFPIALFDDGFLLCQRPSNHKGPHLSKNGNDQWHLWQTQNCGNCDSGEDDDTCVTHAEVLPDIAEQYLTYAQQVGEGWQK